MDSTRFCISSPNDETLAVRLFDLASVQLPMKYLTRSTVFKTFVQLAFNISHPLPSRYITSDAAHKSSPIINVSITVV